MVYEIIPTYLGGLSSPTYIQQTTSGPLFSLLIEQPISLTLVFSNGEIAPSLWHLNLRILGGLIIDQIPSAKKSMFGVNSIYIYM